MIVTSSPERIKDYISYIKKEIDLVSGLIDRERKTVQMHWGGGTPTYLDADQIRDVYGHIRKRFDFSDDAEVAMEIDPRRLTREQLSAIREVGFNRVSFGVQDFDPKVQEAVNRIQPEEMSREVLDWSRELGFHSVNVDLIYGLPYQSVESYTKTLESIIDIGPDRLAVFNYAYVPWLKKHQEVISEASLPEPAERLNLLKLIIEELTGAGYVYIGMDHFARPEDELSRALENHSLYRNFQGYSTRAEAEVYAMGITSISQLQNVYAQNAKDIESYNEMIDDGQIPTHVGYRLDDDDKIRRYVITELMCNNRILKEDVKSRYGIDFDTYFSESINKLDEFVKDGLLTLSPDRLQVHETGRLVIRNIAMAFDRYLDSDQGGKKPIYSRTV